MKSSVALSGAFVLVLSSFGAWAQVAPPPGETPVFGEPAPVPGTEGTITSPNAALADQIFIAGLSGLEEVPPRDTDASGAIAVTLNPDGTSLHYRLSVENIENVTGAHLHLGLPGENGPIVVPILGEGAPGDAANPPQGPQSGVIAEGDITAANLVGPLTNTPFVVLMELMRSGAIYANVHTSQIPEGEIRGQVEGVGPNADALQLLQGMPGIGEDGTGDGENGGATGGGTTGGTGGDANGGGTGGTTDGGTTGDVGTYDGAVSANA